METMLGLHIPTISSGWASGPDLHLCRTESDIQSVARSSIENTTQPSYESLQNGFSLLFSMSVSRTIIVS